MRRKFFLISLCILVATTVSITTLLVYYFQDERMDFIDDQIRQTATAIIDSELSDLRAYDYEKVDSIISEELGPDRIGKFFIIRNQQGEILFQTQSISLLNVSVPRDPKWVTIKTDKLLIRAVNLALPRSKTRTLQVGVIAESSFFYWSALDGRAIAFLLAIPSLILIGTWVLSSSLFAPVKAVGNYVKDATKSLDSNHEVPSLPAELKAHLKERQLTKDDEFQGLLTGLVSFAERINSSRKFTRRWTHQMVHELKTPLTVLNHDLEVVAQKHSLPKEDVQAINASVQKVSRTITNFLDWAELTYQGQKANLHVVKISSSLQNLQPAWQKVFGQRVRVSLEADFQVLCDPNHLEQLINNLVTNALKYSDKDVSIKIQSGLLTVSDHGDGIPESVLENLGNPFNKGPRSQDIEGSGLGLAWVKTVAELYQWKMDIASSSAGTQISIHFPVIDIS